MLIMEIDQETLDFLKRKAAQKTYEDSSDEFNPYEWFGGNMDDAYVGGINDGEINLAREILTMLKVTQ